MTLQTPTFSVAFDGAHQLRRAAFWAQCTCTHFDAQCCDAPGLKLRQSPLRLEATTKTGGSTMIRIQAGAIILHRSEATHALTLTLALPANITKAAP
jgi:hypothetical protein